MEISPSLKSEIDRTIRILNEKKFPVDPIAGSHFSKIASVISSSYKRHGFILERAILEAVSGHEDFDAWEDKEFFVSASADALATEYADNPIASLDSSVPYQAGRRTLQIDLAAFNKREKSFYLYEVKRGNGYHDAGKKRQMMRDLLCMQVLAQSYAKERGYDTEKSGAFIIFYYGKRSIKAPFSLSGSEMNKHFGFDIFEYLESANNHFKQRLWEILSE